MPRFQGLDAWLDWQQSLHPSAIELGLDRVTRVAERLGVLEPVWPVITVAGTNGKGSCVAYMDSILRTAGYRTGAYTSPHLLRYNERIRLDGQDVEDSALVEAFETVDQARGEISLTYFEFGTLAALVLFERLRPDVVLLEVGLGGRLDAVNVLDSDAAIVASVGLDHVDWLGATREAIGREKAGVFRAGRPAICGDRECPDSVRETAAGVVAPLFLIGRDYDHVPASNEHWTFQGAGRTIKRLPVPSLAGRHQLDNAATAAMTLTLLGDRLPVGDDAVREGLRSTRLPGRFQVIPGRVEWILDVAHNREAAKGLAQSLRGAPPAGRTHGVVAILARKDAGAVIEPLLDIVDVWYPLQLPDQDARPAQAVADLLPPARVENAGAPEELFARVVQEAEAGDRIVVFGSFRTVEEALRRLTKSE